MVVSPRSVAVWSPFGELQRFQREFDSYFANGNGTRATPWIRFQSDDHGARAEAELPGFAADEVHVDVRGSVLTIQGKRPERGLRAALEFEKNFDLGFPIEETKVVALLKNGVLELDLPRAEADKPKRIAVRGE